MGVHRVAFVSDFFFPSFGGVEVHIYNVAQCLIRRGHKVIVITRSYGDRSGVRYTTNGLKVYYLPFVGVKLPPGTVTMPMIVGTLPLLRSIFIRERITIVHGQQTTSNLCHEALFHALVMGIRCCFTDHSLFGFADMASIHINKVLQWRLSCANHVICVSNTLRENTVLRAKVDPKRVSVIPNATDTLAFTPPEDMKYRTWGPRIKERGGVTIVAITRLVYRKGADLFADVIPDICRRHPDVYWVIGGDGPRKSQLEQMVERHNLFRQVTLLGALKHSEVQSVLNMGHVFLNCSLTEAFCIALIEAASCGLIGVSTRVGGVPEVLPPNMLILAEPEPNSIIVALEEALRRVPYVSPWEFHDSVRRFYSWDWVAERTEKVYDIIAAEPQRDFRQALNAYANLGPVFGRLCALALSFVWLLYQLMEWIVPTDSIDIAVDYPWDASSELDVTAHRQSEAVSDVPSEYSTGDADPQ